jgi:hypothetical protein
VHTRLIIAEDLCNNSIMTLGSALEIHPWVLAHHLKGSSYIPELSRNEEHMWLPKSQKDFISLKWVRPVYRKLVTPRNNNDLVTLADKGEIRWRSQHISDGGISHPQHSVSLVCNIVRKEWPLQSMPGNKIRLSGWEEKVTIWSRKQGKHTIRKYLEYL